MKVGGRYNWRNQPERLIYIGRNLSPGQSRWYQFQKVGAPAGSVWCEVLDEDLHRLEETGPQMDPAAARGVMGTSAPQPFDPEDNLETAIRRFGGRMVLNRTPRGRKLLKQMEAIYAEKDDGAAGVSVRDGQTFPGQTPMDGNEP
jgi:hypothetical protein